MKDIILNHIKETKIGNVIKVNKIPYNRYTIYYHLREFEKQGYIKKKDGRFIVVSHERIQTVEERVEELEHHITILYNIIKDFNIKERKEINKEKKENIKWRLKNNLTKSVECDIIEPVTRIKGENNGNN